MNLFLDACTAATYDHARTGLDEESHSLRWVGSLVSIHQSAAAVQWRERRKEQSRTHQN